LHYWPKSNVGYSAYASDNKLVICLLKRGFCGVCIKRSFVDRKERNTEDCSLFPDV